MNTPDSLTRHYIRTACDGVILCSYILGLAFVVLVLGSEAGAFF